MSKEERAKLIAYSDQIGFTTVKGKDGRECVVPVNPQAQAIFEAALWRLRQR
jgi:hypothetical protein